MKDKTKARELTKGELQVMNVLWERQHATVNEVLEQMAEPRPAYNTVLTFLRILTEKGFVGYDTEGKAHRYRPLVQKSDYSRTFLKGIKNALFDGSAASIRISTASPQLYTRQRRTVTEREAIPSPHPASAATRTADCTLRATARIRLRWAWETTSGTDAG